jgi:predicted O-methyltransferase YrrM
MNELRKINKENFKVLKDEFKIIPHNEFNNLIILDSLGLFERLISLLKELSLLFESKPNILFYNITNGGYIPIKCSKEYKNLFIHNDIDQHNDNILANTYSHEISNISIVDKSLINNYNTQVYDIIFVSDIDDRNLHTYNINLNKSVLLCTRNFSKSLQIVNTWYTIKDTEFVLYIPEWLNQKFNNEFYYFIEDSNVLNYNNLIHYTMIVKNAGDSFENILKQNFNLIDRWTILDTGSSDNTIDIINKVLVGKKKGKLFQEPFVNFKDSRNRCLDLAGKDCKFILMLDDTYIIEGNLRWFLDTVRGDQFSDSFSLFIKSNDVCYSSNRIIKSETNLRYLYRIHEVINPKNNINVMVPFVHSRIYDFRSDYMENRTMDRKLFDIELLNMEVEDDPDDPRAFYYLGQTYNLLGNYELALEYYLKRVNHHEEGFKQERIDACFEAARISNFKLNRPWEECEKIYLRSFEMDPTRSDALYFLGIHYYLEAQNGRDVGNNYNTAYSYMKKCFELGYPEHCQYSLKPTLHYYFLPKFLAYISYIKNDFVTGLKCCQLFLNNIKADNSVEIYRECFNETEYKTIKSWYDIYTMLNLIPKNIVRNQLNMNEIPKIVFLADGGFSSWTGRDILTKGMGGSETFVIEIARYLQKSGYFQVVVFCRCEGNDIFEGVEYRKLEEYYTYIFNNNIHTCIIGRYSEYLPISIKSNIENIYMIAHDLDFTGNVIPNDNKLKNIFCLSEWHVEYFSKFYPLLQNKIKPFGYGIDPKLFEFKTKTNTESYPVFIYSSFPIRGLLPLLQMWSKIIEKYPKAVLNIHSDVNGWWSNSMRPEEMNKIKDLLSLYKNNPSVIYHGWTSKNKLVESWTNSDICFYPCTYLETFCHTMLEAAISKTLIVTTDLGALKNTVADRGILLDGNFYDLEFQDKALEELFKIIEDKDKWNYLIEKNYNWVTNLTWENRANTLLQEYILPTLKNPVKYIITEKKFKNVNPLLNYAQMYNWTNDLPENSIQQFMNTLEYIKWKNNTEINILEIGTFAGTSVIKFLEMLPNSKAHVIDRWENYNENNIDYLSSLKELNVEKIFYDNINTVDMKDRVTVFKGDSSTILIDLQNTNKNYFDFIYVDGSHKMLDCYTDLLLSFSLLKKGGILGIDDYLYNKETILESPYEGVNHFINKFNKEIKILSQEYRVFLEKI